MRVRSINIKEGLFEVVEHIHLRCHKLCRQVSGYYLSVAGNMGVFCHED